jgi:hypothetical protein
MEVYALMGLMIKGLSFRYSVVECAVGVFESREVQHIRGGFFLRFRNGLRGLEISAV